MPFGHILGQSTAVATLSRALAAGKVHHAYRFEGQDGVGKELTALAFAQALLCTSGEPLGCGACDACRRVCQWSGDKPSLPLHPDLVFIARNLYPPETLGRKRPELTEISVDQIRRVVLARAAFAPHEGRAHVFIIRDAEQLSPNAANALLKTLEEPRAQTYFVLLTTRPSRLLSTIRSRSLAVRFGPLPDDALRQILCQQGIGEERIASAVEMAAGSASAALEAADPEVFEARQQFVEAVLGAARAPDLAAAVALAESLGRDRLRIRLQLEALAAHFCRESRQAVGVAEQHAVELARCHERVLEAMAALERNASTNLTMTSLVASLRREGAI